MDNSFINLHIKWKVLIIIGSISLLLSCILGILLIIIFNSDIIPINNSYKEDIQEYDDFFKNIEECKDKKKIKKIKKKIKKD